MKLWTKAAGNLKDKNSVWAAVMSRKTDRNPDLEAAVIKATSHDDTHLDYRNAQRVFAWVRTSPAHVKPLLLALCRRMHKTRSWVVALKGLMLMHGIFCCKILVVQRIGRLPFDLSNFTDGHSHLCKTWGFNGFVRSYFAFLDQKAFLTSIDDKGEGGGRGGDDDDENNDTLQELFMLQQLQTLLDMLLQVKPEAAQKRVSLILEAMDCVIVEIFDVYSRICNGVGRVLVKVYASGKLEANTALKVLRRATDQGEQLTEYFELCKNLGVLNASEFPKVEQIPEEDIRELELIINGPSDGRVMVIRQSATDDGDVNKGTSTTDAITKKGVLETVICKKWEPFDEQQDLQKGGDKQGIGGFHGGGEMVVLERPLLETRGLPPPQQQKPLPDLISF